MALRDIKEFALPELSDYLSSLGQPAFHSRQIFSWIYQKGVRNFSAMTDIPEPLRKILKENFYLASLELIKTSESKDGTEKFLLQTRDKNCIEAVSIPAGERVTGCVSAQAGCKFGCRFCASGTFGFKRNLSAGEILEEVLCLKFLSAAKKLTHIVFMGMGEPLDNYDNVLRAIKIINSGWALNIGARRITISTCGIIPGIERLAQEGLQVELSVSLHAADDKTRSRILPANKKYPLSALITACRKYIQKTNRQITFEYVLIAGLNSDLQSAGFLSKILKGLNCKVNLIPANPVKELGVAPPERNEALLFKDYLLKRRVQVTLRKPRGQDITAACGQLRLSYEKK
jgi:23S rRNA (adenine2503-C2)-methyltransferase